MLSVQNLSYSAGKKTILDNLSFSIQPGKVTVLLGPNGAGKSTLLKLLSSELRPQKGSVLQNRKNLLDCPLAELCRCRAVMTQQYTIGMPFTCGEVVLMGRYPYFGSHPSDTDLRMVQEAMAEMKVSELAERPFSSLSGGEQQRVQLARVLAQLAGRDACMQGKLLLLDEPTSSMDYRHQQLSLQKARALAAQGCTIVMVLHDLNLAAQFADDIVFLHKGRLVGQGKPWDILTAENIEAVYRVSVDILHDGRRNYPIIIPKALVA